MKRYLNKNYILIALFSLVILWIISGYLTSEEDASNKLQGLDKRIVIKKYTAVNKPRTIRVYGTTKKVVTNLKTALSGRVKEIYVKEGDELKKGETILIVEKADLANLLQEAEMRLEKEKINLNAATQLLEKKLISAKEYHQARENMAAALARVDRVNEDLSYSTIAAPYDGTIESIDVELGDFVDDFQKAPLGIFSNKNYFRVVAGLAENYADDIDNITDASVKFLNGQEFPAKVYHINRIANPQTRSYSIEFDVITDNPRTVAGETVEVIIELPSTLMYHFPISALVPDEKGNVGVKVVQNGLVSFNEVEVISDDKDGLWVIGLPNEVEIIEVGAQFVANNAEIKSI